MMPPHSRKRPANHTPPNKAQQRAPVTERRIRPKQNAARITRLVRRLFFARLKSIQNISRLIHEPGLNAFAERLLPSRYESSAAPCSESGERALWSRR